MHSPGSEALEWPQVRALLKRYVATSAGDAELALVEPSDGRAAIERAVAEAGEAMAYQMHDTVPHSLRDNS